MAVEPASFSRMRLSWLSIRTVFFFFISTIQLILFQVFAFCAYRLPTLFSPDPHPSHSSARSILVRAIFVQICTPLFLSTRCFPPNSYIYYCVFGLFAFGPEASLLSNPNKIRYLLARIFFRISRQFFPRHGRSVAIHLIRKKCFDVLLSRTRRSLVAHRRRRCAFLSISIRLVLAAHRQ